MAFLDIQTRWSCYKRMIMHADFRLDGISYNRDSLLSFSHVLCNAKNEHQIELGEFLIEWLSDSPDIKLQTSGSTGKPTEIIAQKSMLAASAMTTINTLGLLPTQKALLCLPMRYIAGKMMLIRALLAGLWIDVVKPSSTLSSSSNTYDFTAMTPHQLENSIAHLDRFKQVIVGGAPVDDHLRRSVKGHASTIYATFGMTETYSHIALQNLSRGEEHYTAVAQVKFSKQGDNLVIHAPHIGIEKLITTDCVDLISPTKFVWKGRSDFVINSGGIKLHPEQIEKQISSVISTPFFVFGLPDQQLGESLSIVFEGHIPDEAQSMILKLETLRKYEIPKNYFVLSKFVRLNGKIQRKLTLQSIDFNEVQ